jgi:hypothetical protein
MARPKTPTSRATAKPMHDAQHILFMLLMGLLTALAATLLLSPSAR